MSYPQDLNDLAYRCMTIAANHGFYTPSSITETDAVLAKLMLVVTEVAEAAEAVRHADQANFAEELADILIRVLDLAGAMDLNIQQAVWTKMAKNEVREHMHGGKRA